MPELLFDIKLQLDEASEKTIKSRLNEMQQQVNESTQGDNKAKRKAIDANKALAKWEREVSKEMRASIRLNEERFRRGEITQKQALETANAMEEEAKSIGLVNFETAQGKQNFAAFGNSMRRLDVGFKGIAQDSAKANQSLMNLGRIVQDLPFGFLGISNNIDPAIQSFRSLKEESGGVGGALKALLGSLKGSGGLIFVLGSLLPTVALMAQNGMNFFAKKTKETGDAIDNLSESAKAFISASAGLREGSTFSFLDIDRLTAEIESLERLDSVFKQYEDTQAELERATAGLNRSFSSQNSFLGDVSGAIQVNEENLKSLKEQYGLTAEDVELMRDNLADLNQELRIKSAQAAMDDLGRYRTGLERATNEFIELAEAGVISRSQLSDMARGYVEAQEELLPLIATNEEAREKYFLLDDAIDELFSTYQSLDPEKQKAVNATEEEIDKVDLLARMEKRYQEQLKERMAVLKLIASQPEERFTEEGGELDAFRAKQQIRNQIELESLQDLALKKATIRQKYQQKREELLSKGINIYEETLMIEGEKMTIAQALQLQQHREFENAKTEETRKQEEARKQLRQQAIQSSLAIAGNFISSLQQLNQAQTDETEKQARKKFETQKQLSKAQAVVSGAGAIVKTFETWGFPAGIPFAAAQAAATAIQLAAIERTQFNSASFDQDIGGKSQSGFFETDVPQSERREPRRPNQVQPVNIALRGEFDEEVLSIKAERGKEKRMRGAIFTV